MLGRRGWQWASIEAQGMDRGPCITTFGRQIREHFSLIARASKQQWRRAVGGESSEEQPDEDSLLSSMQLEFWSLGDRYRIPDYFLFFFLCNSSAHWHIILIPVPQLVGGGYRNTTKMATPVDITECFHSSRSYSVLHLWARPFLTALHQVPVSPTCRPGEQ